MHAKFISSALSKAQISEFLGLPQKNGVAKQQLVAQLLELIEVDIEARDRLLATFPVELAVGPWELEELLQCTRVERRRWIQEGMLPVLEYRTFRKAGRDLPYPVHDRKLILGISQEAIAQWRAEHRAQIQERRRAGAQVAAEQKKANQRKREDFFASWCNTIAAWQQLGSIELAVVFTLAYWTVWASRWAKQNHIKSLKGTTYKQVYAARRDAWYERKNQAMRLLARTPYARLSFYRPAHPDKNVLWLCETHYEMKREEYYENVWEFYSDYAAMIQACPQCLVSIEKDYYSLYYLEIRADAFPDLNFSFHVPYPIGKAWLPDAVRLPCVEHIEQDGIFRFGRPLLGEERITHREQDVLAHFERAIAEMLQLPFCDHQTCLDACNEQEKT